MKSRFNLWTGLLFAALLASAATRPWETRPQSSASPAAGSRVPVVVELFTSEGCSSCPPADALLARLDKMQPVPGAQIIALKEHVDYWNRLGWTDPFSSSQFSQRQESYAQVFGSQGVYTPQMVVDGQEEFVGSAESRAQQAIARAARTPKSEVRLKIEAGSPHGGADPLRIGIRVATLPNATPGDMPEVLLAVTEDNLHSDVLRGENAGRKFDHVVVVRRLERIGLAKAKASPAFATEATVKLDAGWRRENLRVVVFVQERNSRRVLAAALVPLPSPAQSSD